MFLCLEREQVALLMEMVETRMHELQAERRKAPNEARLAEIGRELEQLQTVLHQLHECECDVLA